MLINHISYFVGLEGCLICNMYSILQHSELWAIPCQCGFPRTGFNCFIPTHSIPPDSQKPHSHHIFFSLSFPFVLCLYNRVYSIFISLLHVSHPSTLAVSDMVSWAVDGVLVWGCAVMVVAAALMELAKWISRGVQCALRLITDPSVSSLSESFPFTS